MEEEWTKSQMPRRNGPATGIEDSGWVVDQRGWRPGARGAQAGKGGDRAARGLARMANGWVRGLERAAAGWHVTSKGGGRAGARAGEGDSKGRLSR